MMDTDIIITVSRSGDELGVIRIHQNDEENYTLRINSSRAAALGAAMETYHNLIMNGEIGEIRPATIPVE